MNKRQYKKLCKKAAEAMCYSGCHNDDGVWYIEFGGGYDSECDSLDCWPFLKGLFDSDINTVEDNESECGISWSDNPVAATPKNVFSWAKTQRANGKGSFGIGGQHEI